LEIDKSHLESKFDSLNNKIPEDCIGAKIQIGMIEGLMALYDGKVENSLKLFDESLVLAENHVIYSKELSAYKAKALNRLNKAEESFEIIDQYLKLPCTSDTIRCNTVNIKLLILSAGYLTNLNRSDEALDRYLDAQTLMKKYKFKDSLSVGAMYNSIGNIYDEEFEDYRQSIEYHLKALEQLPANYLGRMLVFNNIGHRYKNLNKLDSAALFYNKTISNTKNSRYLIIANQGLGNIASQKRDYKKSIEYHTKSLRYAQEIRKVSSIYKARVNLALNYYLSNDLPIARNYLDKAIKSVETKELPLEDKTQLDIYENLIKVAHYDKNLSYNLLQSIRSYDTISIIEQAKAVKKSATKFEKKLLRDSLERQVLLKENEAEKVKNYRLSTILLLLGLLFSGGLVYQFRNLFVSQKKVNEELVFQNQDLIDINQQLKQRNESLNTKVVSDVGIIIQYDSNNNSVKLEAHRVKYLQAEDDGVRLYYDETSNWTDMPLKTLQAQLPENQFLLIFRGIVVNINHVERVNSTSLKLKDGTELKISRSYKNKIKEMFMNM